MFACAYFVASHPVSDQHFATVLHAQHSEKETRGIQQRLTFCSDANSFC